MLTSFFAGVFGGSSFLAGVVCCADVSEPALKRCCGIMHKNINYDPTHLIQTLFKMLKNAYL
jgi:hypothetical protein